MEPNRALTTATIVIALSLAATGCGRDGKRSASSRTALAPTTATGSATGSGTAAGTASPSVSPSPSPAGSSAGSGAARPTVFTARVERVQRSTVRSSWHPGCPVPLSGLRLMQLTYWGFDKQPHTGELVVNAKQTGGLTKVFKRLYEKRYPIRRMERVDVYKGSDFQSIEADNTSAFNCRNATGSSSWSQHAYGLAVDINPCENPYVSSSGHVEHPACVKYRKRSRTDPGLIHDGDLVVRTFASIGWGWGGRWGGAKDYQHFSSNGG